MAYQALEDKALNTLTGEIIDINLEKNDDEELKQLLDRYYELKGLNEEFERLKKHIKDMFKEKEYSLVGNYQVTGHWVEKRETYIPACKYWDSRIKKVI